RRREEIRKENRPNCALRARTAMSQVERTPDPRGAAMIQIVHPILTSKVGIGLTFLFETLRGRFPMPELLAHRGNIVTVGKAVGPDRPNQATDVLLVRFLLNLLMAHSTEWRARFGGRRLPHAPTFDVELGRRVRLYQQAGGFKLPLPEPGSRPP